MRTRALSHLIGRNLEPSIFVCNSTSSDQRSFKTRSDSCASSQSMRPRETVSSARRLQSSSFLRLQNSTGNRPIDESCFGIFRSDQSSVARCGVSSDHLQAPAAGQIAAVGRPRLKHRLMSLRNDGSSGDSAPSHSVAKKECNERAQRRALSCARGGGGADWSVLTAGHFAIDFEDAVSHAKLRNRFCKACPVPCVRYCCCCGSAVR